MDCASSSNQENALAFDHSMLKILMIEFLRNARIPFSVANNSKFLSMFQYLRPDLVPPTVQELLALHRTEFETFQQWEQMGDDCSNLINEKRIEMAHNHMRGAYLEDCDESNSTGPYTTNHANCSSLKTVPSYHHEQFEMIVEEVSDLVELEPSIKKELEEQDGSFPEQQNIRETVLSYDSVPSEVKPSLEELKTTQVPDPSDIPSSSRFAEEEERSPSFNYKEYHSTPDEEEGEEEDVKPDMDILKLLMGRPDSDQQLQQQQPVIQETIPANGIISICGRKRKHIPASEKYLVFEDLPGIGRWPCLVCHQRMESAKVRSVTNGDAYIMLYVCVMNNLFTLEKAKEYARMQKFKCCASHLTDIYKDALHFMAITDPEKDICFENEKVIDAYHIVRNIKESRFVQKFVFEGSRKHLIPFCNVLKTFFSKYSRQNYQ